MGTFLKSTGVKRRDGKEISKARARHLQCSSQRAGMFSSSRARNGPTRRIGGPPMCPARPAPAEHVASRAQSDKHRREVCLKVCMCGARTHMHAPMDDATGSVRPLLARVLPLSYTAPDACPHVHKSPSTGRRACTSCQAPTRPAVTIQAGTGEKIVVQAQRREASPPDFAAGSLMAACPYLISFSMPSHVVFGVDAEQDGRGSATSGRSR